MKKKSGLNETEFEALPEKLLEQVRFIEDPELKPFLPAAAYLADNFALSAPIVSFYRHERCRECKCCEDGYCEHCCGRGFDL